LVLTYDFGEKSTGKALLCPLSLTGLDNAVKWAMTRVKIMTCFAVYTLSA